MNTRRVSGMVQAAGPGGQALLETLDAFKRKHVSQNKEIIHRNSDLMRANADLSKKLLAAQNELIALRADNLAVTSLTLQLQDENSRLQRQLHAAEARLAAVEAYDGSGKVPMYPQEVCATLESVMAQLQSVHDLCSIGSHAQRSSAGGAALHPYSPPVSPPQGDRAGTEDAIPPITQLQRPPPEARNVLVSAQPDLSLISEGSAEPDTTVDSVGEGETTYASYYAAYAGEEDVPRGEETLHDQLVLRSPTPGQQTQSPTPSPPLQRIVEEVPDATASLRQTRRRGSGALPPPPADLQISAGEAPPDSPRRQPRASISLFADLSVSPSNFTVTGSDSTIGSNSARPCGPSIGASARPADSSISSSRDTLAVLDRRVRPSLSAGNLKEAAKVTESTRTGEAKESTVQANPASSSLKRRRSMSSMESATTATISSTNKSRLSDTISASSASAMQAVPKRKPLTAAMQSRPANAPRTSVTGPTAAAVSSSSSISAEGKKRSATVYASTASSSSASASTLTAARSRPDAELTSNRRRSTTPIDEPPEGDIMPLPRPSASKATETTQTVAAARKVLTDVTKDSASLSPNGASNRIRSASTSADVQKEAEEKSIRKKPSKGKLRETPAETERAREPKKVTKKSSLESIKSIIAPAPALENIRLATKCEETLSESQESQESNASTSTVDESTARGSRRRGTSVNYAEPSLTKKMRQPAGYVPTIKTVASTRNQLGAGGYTGGVRRKSSLHGGSTGDEGRYGRRSFTVSDEDTTGVSAEEDEETFRL